MTSATIGYAKLDPASPITLRAPGRYLPIVVVPGFMGTRLTDPVSKKLAWNPTGFPLSALTGPTPGPFACDYERLQQVSSDLVPDDLHPNEDADQVKATQDIKYFNHVIPPYYGDLAKALAKGDYIANHADAGKLGVRPRVYCCGYDWRQDNAKSAMRLAEVVEEALADTGEEKCMLVVHSMGGLVARHYCRALGGESKVFAVFSIASPMVGAPSAYTQLKHGAPGLYTREFFRHDDDDDPDATMADNAISEGMSVATGAATALTAGPAEAMTGVLGPVYLVLVLGAGRLLTRRETTYFARQIPSAYQLMPTALFCDKHRNWNLFDPLNTGNPPSGYMIKFPTLLDAGVAIVGGVANMASSTHNAGQSITDAANRALHGDPDDRSNTVLEGANSETLEEMAASMVALALAATGSSTQKIDGPTISRLTARITTLIDRATKSFLDCRNNRALYSDIFTGLLDDVALRGISAYNLELMYRFDDSITVQPREVPLYSAASMVGSLVSGVGAIISAIHPETDPKKLFDAQTKAEADALTAARTAPKAYVHPKTISYANTDVPVDGGPILLCLNVLSNYDSNLVKFQLLPNPIGLVMPAPSASSDESALYHGDGTVPFFSASPPNEMLSNPLLSQSKTYTGITHTSMSADAGVIAQVQTHLADLVSDWYKA